MHVADSHHTDLCSCNIPESCWTQYTCCASLHVRLPRGDVAMPCKGSYFQICMQLHDAMLGHQHLHCERQRAVCLSLLEHKRVFQTTVCGVGSVHCILSVVIC